MINIDQKNRVTIYDYKDIYKLCTFGLKLFKNFDGLIFILIKVVIDIIVIHFSNTD
jgi:hypothetical protein